MANDFLDLLARNPHQARKDARKVAPKTKDSGATRRKKFIEGCNAAIAQLKAGDNNPPRGWYVVEAGGISVRPKVGKAVLRVYATGTDLDKFDFLPSPSPLETGTAFFENMAKLAQDGKIESWFDAAQAGQPLPLVKGKPKLDA